MEVWTISVIQDLFLDFQSSSYFDCRIETRCDDRESFESFSNSSSSTWVHIKCLHPLSQSSCQSQRLVGWWCPKGNAGFGQKSSLSTYRWKFNNFAHERSFLQVCVRERVCLLEPPVPLFPNQWSYSVISTACLNGNKWQLLGNGVSTSSLYLSSYK